jgi:hypothetical protein
MDAASLIMLAKARGIDLNHIAGVASNVEGRAAVRKLTAKEIEYRNAEKLSLEVCESAKGRESRTYREAAWSVAELGQAAKGLGAIPWAAALYSFAGSKDGYWLLWQALANEAQRIARREMWTPRVVTQVRIERPRVKSDGKPFLGPDGKLVIDVTYEEGERSFYREELAELVLIEDANRYLFVAAPQLYAIKMKVSVEVWEKQLFQPFRSLQATYDRWLNIARAVIGAWIRKASQR